MKRCRLYTEAIGWRRSFGGYRLCRDLTAPEARVRDWSQSTIRIHSCFGFFEVMDPAELFAEEEEVVAVLLSCAVDTYTLEKKTKMPGGGGSALAYWSGEKRGKKTPPARVMWRTIASKRIQESRSTLYLVFSINTYHSGKIRLQSRVKSRLHVFRFYFYIGHGACGTDREIILQGRSVVQIYGDAMLNRDWVSSFADWLEDLAE